MCGVVAILGSAPVPAEQMRAALDALEHRGPDGSGVWSSDSQKVIVGHRRLAVRGAAEDSQPITSEQGDIAISVNGEFYGDGELRLMLEDRGHRFRTTSDSEVALHLYEEFGLEFFRYLRGEFAFVLWDGKLGRLLAARDRFGIKPLWYAGGGDGNFMVASEAKALFAAGVVKPEWDVQSGWHSLAHQYLPPERSLFRAVHAIPPAHFLIFENREVSLHSYWKPPFETDAGVTSEAVLGSLKESVSMRLESNLRPAFSLSGGIDSSAVVALAAAEYGAPVPAFTVSFFDGDGYDERLKVRAAAPVLGAEINPVPVSREAMVMELGDAVYHSEGLAINGQLVGKFLLSRAIHKSGHNVVLSGEGADEAFLGYAHLQMDAGQAGVAESFGKQAGIMLPGGVGEGEPLGARLPAWLERWPSFLEAKMKFANHYRPLLRDEIGAEFAPGTRVEALLEAIGASNEISSALEFPKKCAWLWTRTALAAYILRTLADGTEMAHSVEGRLPFLDHELFKLAAGTPVEANLRDGGAKMVLREALRSVLPEDLRLRPKHPFLAPALLCDPCPENVKDFISDTFRSASFAGVPFFDARKVIAWSDRLKNASAEEQRAADPALVTMLSCAMLHERFCL